MHGETTKKILKKHVLHCAALSVNVRWHVMCMEQQNDMHLLPLSLSLMIFSALLTPIRITQAIRYNLTPCSSPHPITFLTLCTSAWGQWLPRWSSCHWPRYFQNKKDLRALKFSDNAFTMLLTLQILNAWILHVTFVNFCWNFKGELWRVCRI